MICKIVMKINVVEGLTDNNMKNSMLAIMKNNLTIEKMLHDCMDERMLLRVVGEASDIERAYQMMYGYEWERKIAEDAKQEFTPLALKMNY